MVLTHRITNTGNVPLAITSVDESDERFRIAQAAGSDCVHLVGASVGVGTTVTCTVVRDLSGVAGDRIVITTAIGAIDARGVGVAASRSVAVDIVAGLAVAPGAPQTAIEVTKSASPGTLPEPGGVFAFTVTVRNSGSLPVSVDAVRDSVHDQPPVDALSRAGSNCAWLVGRSVASGHTASCVFTGEFVGNAYDREVNTVTVRASGAGGRSVLATGTAEVWLTDVAPKVRLEKTANPGSRPAPGGNFTFNLKVINDSFEPVLMTSLVDDVHGNLHGRGSCVVGETLAAAGGTYACTYTVEFTGSPGDSQTSVATVTVVDDDGTFSQAQDSARVQIGDPLPVGARVIARTGLDTLPGLALAAGLMALGAVILRLVPAGRIRTRYRH